MQFIDLARQQVRIKAKIDKNIENVLAHGKYIMGPEVKELEDKLAQFTGVKYGIGCSSGTDALILSLMALGIGSGHAIFTTPFTFIATAEVISLLGAAPVFVDIDPDTFNIDPVQLEKTIKNFSCDNLIPKAIITVDLFGLPAYYDEINAIAKKYGLFVIEDAAQSFGAEYKGQKSCGLAEIGCTSFFPAKPLGAYGDGGMCFTNDENILEIIRSCCVHGQGINKYENVRIGINGRLDTIQAAILLAKFEIFPEEILLRQKVASNYNTLINQNSLINSKIITPKIFTANKSAWAQYSLLAQDEKHRSAILSKLKEAGIPSAIYYPTPLHCQKVFTYMNYNPHDFPVSDEYSKRIFSLPMHPYLEHQEQVKIVDVMVSV